VRKASKAELGALVEEATVDCYGPEEQVTGLYTMIESHLETPFETEVLGVAVTVQNVELTDDGRMVAICVRGTARQAVCIPDLPLPQPRPAGAEWIDAYRYWLRSPL
jgi:hypothetical protein